MAFIKWIGGFVGWMAGGPLGALAGFVLGSFFDKSITINTIQTSGNEDPTIGHRNSFLFSMLVMASYIIRADGKIMHSVCSDFRAPKNKSVTVSIASPSMCHEVMGPDAMILVF